MQTATTSRPRPTPSKLRPRRCTYTPSNPVYIGRGWGGRGLALALDRTATNNTVLSVEKPTARQLVCRKQQRAPGLRHSPAAQRCVADSCHAHRPSLGYITREMRKEENVCKR